MNFHNITHEDMNNGDGLRVVLWVAGCDHHCKNCQNPVTWNPDDGLPFTLKDEHEIFGALERESTLRVLPFQVVTRFTRQTAVPF